MKTLYILLIVILLAGCAPSSGQLTATAVVARAQTETAAPSPTATLTATATFTPTSTATATETPRPTNTATPVPAAVGETVTYNGLEITLLKVATHTQVMLSDFYGYDAKDGYIFVDLAVLVRNRGTHAVGAKMGEVYLIDEKGKSGHPFGGGYKTVNLERPFDAMASIKLDVLDPNQFIRFEKDTYLRLVWVVTEHQDYLFGIQDWPSFSFSLE